MKLHLEIGQYEIVAFDSVKEMKELLKETAIFAEVYDRYHLFPIKVRQAKEKLSAQQRIASSKKAQHEILLTPEEIQ